VALAAYAVVPRGKKTIDALNKVAENEKVLHQA